MIKLVLIVVYRIVKTLDIRCVSSIENPSDTSNILIKIGYPLSFVVQTDTLDLLISIGYSLSFALEFDSSNLSIGFYKNNRKCLGFNY